MRYTEVLRKVAEKEQTGNVDKIRNWFKMQDHQRRVREGVEDYSRGKKENLLKRSLEGLKMIPSRTRKQAKAIILEQKFNDNKKNLKL